MTRVIPFGRWHPDRRQINSPVLLSATGVRPTVAGFGPMGQLVEGSSALTGSALGAFNVLDGDGNVVAFVGTSDGLFKLDTTTQLTSSPASIIITGQTSWLNLVSTPASITLTGQTSTLVAVGALMSSPGNVSVTGQTSTLQEVALTSSPASITVTGQTSTLGAGALQSISGSITVTGQTSTLAAGALISASGSISVTGQTSTLSPVALQSTAGSVTVTGQTSTLASAGTTTFTVTRIADGYTNSVGSVSDNYTFGASDSGNLLIVTCFERSADGHSAHSLSDDNSGSWTKWWGYDNELSNSSARCSMSVWYREVTASDNSTNVTFTKASDQYHGFAAYMVAPDASYSWTAEEYAVDGSGTAHWDNTNSGNTASVSGSDLFEIALASGRRNSTNSPTVAFDDQTDTEDSLYLTTNGVGFVMGAYTSGQASGVKSAQITSTGSGIEGICAVLTFSG